MNSRIMNCRSAMAALLALALTVSADPLYLVDTGPGNDNFDGTGLYNTAPSSGSFEFLAVAFSVDAEFTITGIQGWIAHGGSQPSHVNFIIYTDSGGLPNVNNELFDQVVTVPPYNGGAQWSGLTELSWNLPGGNYWLAFEVRQPELQGNVMPWGVPNPLPTAYNNGANGTIGYILGAPAIGVRIEGVVVPEPASLCLFPAGAGLMACVLFVSRRSNLADHRSNI